MDAGSSAGEFAGSLQTAAIWLALLVVSLAACGPEPVALVFDSTTTSTTQTSSVATASSSPAAPQAAPGQSATADAARATNGDWIPAASNLEGTASCASVSFVSAHPDRDAVIIGVGLEGLFIDQGGKGGWAPLGTGPDSDPITNGTSAIVYDPDAPDTFWESGIYFGGGVYRTDDGGGTFRALGDISHVDLVSVDLTDPARRTLIAGLHERPTAMRSSDGGETWVEISAGLPPDIGFASSPLVLDAETYLLGTNNGAGAGVFRTSDGALSWERVWDFGVSGAPIVSDDDRSIIWLLEHGAGTIRSVDGGLTWQASSSGGWIDPTASTIVELSDGRVVTVGGATLVVSSDRGATWDPFGPELPYQPNGVAFAPARQAIYAWQSRDCSPGQAIRADSVLRLEAVAGM